MVPLTTFIVNKWLEAFLRSCGVDVAIEQAGAQVRFLPPRRPDFNSIELAFALKRSSARCVPPHLRNRCATSSRPHSVSLRPTNAPTTPATAATELLRPMENALDREFLFEHLLQLSISAGADGICDGLPEALARLVAGERRDRVSGGC
jgi:hypothetical protein